MTRKVLAFLLSLAMLGLALPVSGADADNQPDTLKDGYAYVSDLPWKSSNALAGTQVTRDGNNNAGETIYSPDLLVYAKGIGMHACDNNFGSYVELDISGYGFTKFAARIGMVITLSAYDITMADAIFSVSGDGRELFRSDLMKYMQPFAMIEVDVTGIRTLRLAVSGAGSIAGDWCAWANAVLSVSGDVEQLFRADGVLIYDANAAEPAETHTSEPPVTTATEPITQTEPVTQTEPPVTSAATAESSMQTETPETEQTSAVPEGSAAETEAAATVGTDTGCASVLGAGAVGIVVAAVAAGAACRRKNKEDEDA